LKIVENSDKILSWSRAAEPTETLLFLAVFCLRRLHMDQEDAVKVFCPVCLVERGKKKLLFKRFPETSGQIAAFCKGCKKEILVDLEPMSRD
jgi:hypothetical protein